MRTAILKATLFTPFTKGRWGLPLCIEDEPGCGKTAVVEQLAEEFGLPCETLSPGERGEAAFGVVPVPTTNETEQYAYLTALTSTIVDLVNDAGLDAGKALEKALGMVRKPSTMTLAYPRPDWTSRLDDGGVIFVDELTTAPPIIQAALLGLLLARRVGSHTFGPRVRILAAYNPPELAAGGFDLAAPLANRAGHMKWGAPTIEEHVAYMLSGGTGNGGHLDQKLDAKEEEDRVMAAWPAAFANARGLETAFLTKRSALKNQCPKAGDPKASRAWPSDRTWEMATRALAGAKVHGLSDSDTEEFVAAFIGAGPASEWFQWMTDADLPDPAKLLDGKETFEHNKARVDRTAAVLNACVALVSPKNADRRVERVTVLWKLLEKLAAGKLDLDVLVPPVHALVAEHLHGMQVAGETLAAVQPVLRAANIRAGK